MTTVLVTGATGTIGSQVVKALAGSGLDVHIGVRSPEKTSVPGATKVRFDWADPASFEAAFAGVDRLFLLTPFQEEFETVSKAAILAAKKVGVKHIVKLSAFGASEEAPLDGVRQHARVEKALAESGVAYTLLQPTFFMDNMLNYQAGSIKEQGAIYGASGGQRSSYVSSADVGAVAAAVLRSPEAHAGKTYILTGGEALSDAEVASLIGKALGKEVNFVDLELSQYEGGVRQAGTPEWQVAALVGLESIKRNGWAAGTTTTIRDILGRAPETYASYLDREIARLR
jgi:uncharacterized protein YbjT (DUF2867 family)